ncbi:MAG: CRISPR-associated protein Cas2 [Pirellulaceae bacterium]|nr:MAG: CRISPR-associated protein Cas2 [Pirellulaceae bacterium]
MPHIVVCYDIVQDRRRTRVMKRLREYLPHVQKSVFEGEVSEGQVQELKHMLMGEIDLVEDTVRIYRLCARCIPMTEIVGTGQFIEEEGDEVI